MKSPLEYNTFKQRINHLSDLHKFKECIKMCKETIQLFPEEWWPYYILANSYYNSNQAVIAYQIVNNAITLFPDNYHFWYLKGQILYFSKHYDKALEWLNKALEKAPDNALVKALLAECYQRKKDYPQGILFALQALEINPSQEIAMKALAWCKLKQQAPDANLAIESYLRFYPTSFDGHHLSAVYFLKKDQKEKATEHFRTALRIRPGKEKVFEEYHDFLLEYVPEYYQNNSPSFKILVILQSFIFIFLGVCLWMEWSLLSKIIAVLFILIPSTYMVLINNFMLTLRRNELSLSALFADYKKELIAYYSLLTVCFICALPLLYFNWIIFFNITALCLLSLPKTSFLKKVHEHSTGIQPYHLINVYMLVLSVYVFFSARQPVFIQLIIVFISIHLNIVYEIWRSKKDRKRMIL